MSGFWPIFKRELRSYFVSPIAYVVMVMFLAITGYFFAEQFCVFQFHRYAGHEQPDDGP